MRIAPVANPAAGGRPDPVALAAAMAGADVMHAEPGELEALAPDRIAVAGGDGSIAPGAYALITPG